MVKEQRSIVNKSVKKGGKKKQKKIINYKYDLIKCSTTELILYSSGLPVNLIIKNKCSFKLFFYICFIIILSN